MIAGGSEAAITPMGMAGFSNMQALSTRNDEPEKASRPFDRDRDGFVMGEGCGILILEELESALKRNARIYCEVFGYGLSGEAYHITALEQSGAIESIAVVLTIESSIIPPTINLDNPDEKCDLNYTAKVSQKRDVNVALSNSMGFGGHNVTLGFKKYS
jgi:3-oxoacyl-[acyl-carrier-protein] synthase II